MNTYRVMRWDTRDCKVYSILQDTTANDTLDFTLGNIRGLVANYEFICSNAFNEYSADFDRWVIEYEGEDFDQALTIYTVISI